MARNQIKIGAIISYLALFINILIGLLYTPWLISSIGNSDYGLYTLAMSIIGLLAFDFGLGTATTKFTSHYIAQNRQDKANELLGMIYKLYLLVDCIIVFLFILVYLFIPDIFSGLSEAELSRFRKVFAIAASYCIISFPFIPLNGVLTAYEQFIQLKCCDLFSRIFIVLCMSICLLLGYGLFAVVIINSIAGIITICLKILIVSRNTPLKIQFRYWNSEQLKEIAVFILWTTIAALAARLIFNIAPSILGIFADTSSIAVFGVVITLEGFVYMFANAINGMFLPRVSRMVAANDPNAILELMIRIGRIQIYVIGFILIWIIAFGEQFICLWMGPDYHLVYPCLLLVVFPSFLHLPQEIGLTYIIAANKVKAQSYVYLIMGVINIILAIPLSIKYGVIGISISIFIAFIIRTIGLNYIFVKHLSLKINSFYYNSYIKQLPSLILSLATSIGINHLISIDGWLSLIIKSCICIVLYFIIIWFTSMNSYEKDLLVQPLINRH